jgi:hypothetical protein
MVMDEVKTSFPRARALTRINPRFRKKRKSIEGVKTSRWKQ